MVRLRSALIASLVAWGVSGVLALPNISLIFLAAVLLVAVRSSMGPALACAGLSFLAYDFLFIPPSFSLNIQREEDVLTLLFFLLMSALTGKLAARQRRQLQALRDTQEQTSELLDLSRKMTAATDRKAVLAAAEQHFSGWKETALVVWWTVTAQAAAPARCRPVAGGGGRSRRKKDRWRCSRSLRSIDVCWPR